MNRLKSLLRPPEPTGTPETIRSFGVSDHPLTQDALTVDGDAWRIAFDEARSVRLFEIEQPNVEQCILTYRAHVRTEDAQGAIYLEMWCRFAGKGEFFSKGLQQAVRGTTDWSVHETPFLLKNRQRPDLIKLNVVAGGSGTAWIKGMELTRTPLK